MGREILFRGKRVDNGEWVEGLPYEAYDEISHIRVTDQSRGIIAHTTHEIISETVGQYTGFTDKNGTKIFEGDVVRELGYNTSQGIYQIDRKIIIDFLDTFVNLIIGSGCDCSYEVIGNIHDNPELLEVAE